ncbi:MAG TPA: restriction endonuclease subunit S [Thermoanaerobaculia bacterium]
MQYSPAPFFVIDTAYYVVPKTDLDMQWLYYAIKHHKLGEVDDGSPIPSTTRSAVYMLDLDVPPPEQQRAIAQILGALDAKIELNQRMNETLEAIARTLFKSWFVDFDPVHAKAKGRDPGLPEGLAALFPDSFESSGLREIPHGWRHGTLGEIAENPHRIVQPSRIDPAAPYIGLGHMPQRSISLSKWGCAEDLESSKFEFAEGEILFGKLRPYFHKVGLAPVDGVCSTDILVVRPKDSIWFGFVLGHVASDEFIAYANSGATGTRMPRTTWQEMARYELIVPPRQVVAQYNDYLEIFTKRVIANIHEARTLASLHETLLPKLISGELRIRNAERFSGGRS